METPEERKNDPAWQAVDEAGGGEAEGFEQSEELLIEYAENAEHDDALDGFPEEREEDPDRQSYGDADEIVKGSEVVGEEGVPPEGGTDS
jgi:hypothetical protein